MSKERPLLFNRDMVLATLDGRKSQTRRTRGLDFINEYPATFYLASWTDDVGGRAQAEFRHRELDSFWKRISCPYGKIGDRLWVRETLAPGSIGSMYPHYAAYKASLPLNGKPDLRFYPEALVRPEILLNKVIPSIHMPRWASRILMEITGLRVERVQSIDFLDANAEGCPRCMGLSACGGGCDSCPSHDPISWYRRLWDSINASRGLGWDLNPWVWVVRFKILEIRG